MKPSFGTCCYFHHPYLFSAWNMACQVKGKNASISFIMHSPSQMSTGPVMLVVSCLMVMPNWKKDCFSKEGIQPCKSWCPKANALVWIMFCTLTILVSDLCIVKISQSWSKLFNCCTYSQVGQGSHPPQLRSALKASPVQKASKPESSSSHSACFNFGLSKKNWCPMKPSFGTFQNFHHPCMFEALNIACQVKSPRSYRNDCQHIIYALAAPNVYRSRDVDVVLSNSDA